MSKEKVKKNRRGGKREGAGRPKGSGKKTKICVSVTKTIWHDALSSWSGKASHLVEKLVSDALRNGALRQNLEAIT